MVWPIMGGTSLWRGHVRLRAEASQRELRRTEHASASPPRQKSKMRGPRKRRGWRGEWEMYDAVKYRTDMMRGARGSNGQIRVGRVVSPVAHLPLPSP